MAVPSGVPLVFFISYMASAFIGAALAFKAYRHRSERPVLRWVILLSIAAGVWAISAALKLLGGGLAFTLFWHRVGYLGVLALPVALAVFAYSFAGPDRPVPIRLVLVLYIVPALAYLALLTDPLHHLYYETVRLESQSGATILVTVVGPLFWVFAIYSWGLLFLAIGLLTRFAIDARSPYDRQSVVTVVGILLPWPVNILFNTGFWPYPGLDPTPIAVGIGLGMVGFVTFHGRFLDLLPIAREEVFQAIEDPVVIIDDRGQIADFNTTASRVFGLEDSAIGDPVDAVLPASIVDETTVDIWETSVDDQDRFYTVQRQPITNATVEIGTALVLHEVTALKKQQLSVQRESDLKEAVREAIIDAMSREEVEAMLCDRLIESGFRSAWIGGLSGGAMGVRTFAGVDGSAPPTDLDDPSRPWRHAIDRQEVIVSEPDDRTDEPPYGAIAAVPMTLKRLQYGVLVVESVRSSLDRYDRRLLSELADTLAFAFATIERRELLFGDYIREARLRLNDPDHYLIPMTTDERFRDCSVTVYEIHPVKDQAVHFVTVDGADAEQVRSAIVDHPTVISVESTVVEDGPDRLTVALDPPTVGTTLADLGGNVRSMRVEDGRIEVTVEFSRFSEIQQVIDRFEERFVGTELVSLRDRERDAGGPTGYLEETLTNKQRRALEAAYLSGFFERPQRRTAEAIAGDLDISRSTFLHHLREAEQRLMARTFE